MNDRARAWLAARAGAVPPSLEARMENAVDGVRADAALPDALAEAALRCLQQAIAAGDDRRAAWDLLAADALITAGCEAAAEAGLDAGEYCRRFGPDRAGALLTRATAVHP